MICEEDYLLLSGLQHFAFCPRQWALIHLEKQWADNFQTANGTIFHTRAHDTSLRERRGDTLIVRNLSILSHTLKLSGQCDVVEFHQNADGVSIHGESDLWLPYPVEYKRGKPKESNADLLQLCAQAMCLEEMLCCSIPEGALYYGETRHRMPVLLTEDLREQVRYTVSEMYRLYQHKHTPHGKRSKSCQACSLKEICLPALQSKKSALTYLQQAGKDLS